MSGHTYLFTVGRATSCACSRQHAPRPARYVWHHVLPQVCGGTTTADNLVSVCDNAHYAIHVVLWQIAHTHQLGPAIMNRHLASRNKFIRKMAQQGFAAAELAGTVQRIPNEADLT